MGDFEEFLKKKRTLQTRVTYHYGARQMVGDPNDFIILARDDRRKAPEGILEDYVVAHRDVISSATLHTRLMAVKSFLDYHDVPLSWKRINGSLPAVP